MIIRYSTRSVYGNDLHYVVDPHQAEVIGALTGRKTLTSADMLALRALGHEVVQVHMVKSA